MRQLVITCDVCKEEKQEKEMVTAYLAFSPNTYRSKSYDVCKECATKHHLINENTSVNYDYPTTTAEQLVSLIEEIARNAVRE